MIRFSCICKFAFEVPAEMAGTQMQCPECHRLVDVPSMDELQGIGEDGAYRMSAAEPGTDPEHFERMRRAFAKEKVSEEGLEIDLRQTHEQFLAAGTEEHYEDYSAGGTVPKYDPETGELVRPLEVKGEPRVMPVIADAVPLAQTALNYASPGVRVGYSIWSPFLKLFAPINMASMFFVFLTHVFIAISVFSLFSRFIVELGAGLALIAHYGVVMEEIGIEELDEIPRFMRHFNIADDIWLPFARIFLAWMICFGPGWVVWMFWGNMKITHPAGLLAAMGLDAVGLVFFPAIVLTTVTSGSFSNLRPDRVLGTIGRIGAKYAFFVVLYFVAITIYMVGFVATPIHVAEIIGKTPFLVWLREGFIWWGLLALGIVLMHWFAWLMGMAYRTGHMEFPWVFQQMVRDIPGVTGPRWAKSVAGLPRSQGFPVQKVESEGSAS